MFISSPFTVERHPRNRVSICANEIGGSWSGMLAVNTAGLDFNVYLSVEDIEALAAACAATLRKMREADEADRFDPETAEKETV